MYAKGEAVVTLHPHSQKVTMKAGLSLLSDRVHFSFSLGLLVHGMVLPSFRVLSLAQMSLVHRCPQKRVS